MTGKQIWIANAYRNLNYLMAGTETGEALAVDPLDHEKRVRAARDEGWTITISSRRGLAARVHADCAACVW